MANQLTSKRRAQGFTQKSLADALGISRVTVNNWENGRFQPHPVLGRALGDLLGVEDVYALLNEVQ